jgi:2-polyprenyl-6-methoxyphenol hydroxylase-like FAD-dependent oxidoreductase
MANVESVLVVGAGICGLGVGAALAQRGIRVETVEIKHEPNVFGVGINQPGNSMRALRALGVAEEVRAAGFQFDRWDFHDRQGELVVSCPAHLASEGIPHHNGLSRPDLHRILIGANERAGVDVRYGVTVEEMTQDGDAVHVTFTDGRRADYDLVVGCDGVNSSIRNRVFGEEYAPTYTGYGVWRLTVARPPQADCGALFQGVEAKAGYIPLSHETMYLLLVTPEPYRSRYDKAQFPAMLRERLAQFGGIVAEIRDEIRDDDDVVYGPLHEIRLPLPWFQGRVVICGDAAHACTPHLTQGAGMALEDAIVLADELDRDRPLEESLLAFGERRFPRTRLVQDASRGILEAESSINADNIEIAFAHMREELPGQTAAIDAVLVQPA